MLVVIWIGATVAATTIAWAGVRSVVTDIAAPLPAASAAATGAQATAPTTVPASDAPAIVRTYDLVGGTATVRFTADAAEVLGAVPASGFAVDVEPEDDGIRVDFESDDHRSRLRAWWRDGPRRRIEEEARDGDDDRADDAPAVAPEDDGDDDRGRNSGSGSGNSGPGGGGNSGSHGGED